MFQPYSCNPNCIHAVFPERIWDLLFGSYTQEEVASIWVSICHLHKQLISKSVDAGRLRSYLLAIYSLIDESNKKGTLEFKADFILMWQESCQYLSSIFDPVLLIESESIIELMHTKTFSDLLNEPRVINWIEASEVDLTQTSIKRARIETCPSEPETETSDYKSQFFPFSQFDWVKEVENYINKSTPVRIFGPWRSGKTSVLKYLGTKQTSQDRKVVFIDGSLEKTNLIQVLQSSGSFFTYLAPFFGTVQMKVVTVTEFFTFVRSLNLSKSPLLIMDEFDSFIEVEKYFPGVLADIQLLMHEIYSDSGKTVFSAVIAGNFNISAIPENICEFGDDDMKFALPKNLSPSIANKPFNPRSPWNKTVIIETQPFTLDTFKTWSRNILRAFNVNSFSNQIICEICYSCLGHPALCSWFLSCFITTEIYKRPEDVQKIWLNERIDSILTYSCATLIKIRDVGLSSSTLKDAIKTMLDHGSISIYDFNRASDCLRAIGIAKLKTQDTIEFTCRIVKECFYRVFLPSAIQLDFNR
jgi:hypothetical protein